MRSRLTALLLGLIMAFTIRPASAAPSMDQYVTTPFWLEGRTIPLVMLVLERDWKMFYPAYNNLSDLDGDGALDIGFNPKVTYVGYFDPDSCYQYDRNSSSYKAETGLFKRFGPTTAQSQGDADALALANNIDDTNLVYPASKHGVCTGGGERSQGLGLWHGNWLNYALTSRMDAIRKVLYGGKRTTDTSDETILEMVRVPANANVWGGELYANDVWEEYAPSSPWYDIEKFTGFSRPAPGAMHFWARGDYYWTSVIYGANPTPSSTSSQQTSATKNPLPLFRFVADIPTTNRHPFLKTPLRIWDWSGDHASHNSIPSDGHLANSKDPSGNTNNNFMANKGSNAVAWHFAARVQVCKPDASGEVEAGCREYNYQKSNQAQTSYKPIGLLQEYGESEKMFFGLLTGSISHPANSSGAAGLYEGYRYRGGVVRHHIGNFDEYVNYVSYSFKDKNTGVTSQVYGDGTIVRRGDRIPDPTDRSSGDKATITVTGSLIDTIDSFEITGIGSARSYVDGSQAGNPLGEMVWEAVRYLGGGGKTPLTNYAGGGGLNPSGEYGPTATESSVTDVKGNSVKLTKLSSWAGRRGLGGNANDCPKPVILAISEVFPDHDGNDVGNDYPHINDLKDTPRSDFAKVPGSLVPDGKLDIDQYLKIITTNDKLNSSLAGNKLFFYPDNRGLCSARKLQNGLEDIVGHCPSEPSLEGSYNLAAVAYYAHTHDFNSLAGQDRLAANIDFYAVGIPGNFPDITLNIDNDRSMTLMPIAMTAPLDAASNRTEGAVDDAFRTLLNFFIEYWQTDDGHSYEEGTGENRVAKFRKIPYKVKFRTNFEFTTFPCFVKGGNSNNWERDLFNSVTISLLARKTAATAPYIEDEPLYINSGPFKTRNRTLYLQHRTAYRGGNQNAYVSSSSQPYYYAFKRPHGQPFDISTLMDDVVGVAVHSDSTGSGYGASGQTGYTITGVTFPGAYLDVGLNRSDYPIYYSGSNCKPSKNVFVPNIACGDEAVPLDPAGSGLPGAQWNFAANGTHDNPSTFNSHGTSTVITNGGDCGYYHPPTLYDDLLTPAECPYAGYLDDTSKLNGDPDMVAAYPGLANGTLRADEACGKFAAGFKGSGNSKTYPNSNSDENLLFKTSKMRYVQVRSFKFDTSANQPVTLRNPMWLAAKYGGFKDANGNAVPDLPSEWRRGGSGVGADDPYNYFGVANMSELPDQLGNAFEAIADSVATGTATASSINTVLGGGLSIQTEYNTEYKDKDSGSTLKWSGAVYAFFVDKWGNLRADTNGDQRLNMVTSPPLPSETTNLEDKALYQSIWNKIIADNAANGVVVTLGDQVGDLIVHTATPSGGSGAALVYLCRDIYGDNNKDFPMPGDVAYPANPSDPSYAKDRAKYPRHADCKQVKNFYEAQPVWNAAEQLTKQGHENRDVYSYFETSSAPTMHLADGSVVWPAGGVNINAFKFENSSTYLDGLHKLMGQDNKTTTGKLIDYIRGKEFDDYRGRTARLPWALDQAAQTWIMGDVINSKPVIVGDAVSNFHLLYKSQSYVGFKEGKGNGAAARRRQMAYFGANDGMLYAVNLGFFGALKEGLAGYDFGPADDASISVHARYKDRPLGDVLWSYVPPAVLPHLQWLADPGYRHGFYVDLKPYVIDITDSGGNWRSILLVGLRLGGRSIELVNAGTADPTYSYSEYFALDVTDPDSGPPKLLWRFSHPYLGLPTATPSIVRSGDEWYAVLPSGPTSDEQPTASNSLTQPRPQEEVTVGAYEGRSTQAARVFIVNARTGKLERDPLTDSKPLIASEDNSFFNDTFLPRAVNVASDGTSWSHYVVYMGMTAVDAAGRDTGAVYRLQMVEEDTGVPLPVKDWKLTRMYKTDKPVTGAVNAAYDPMGNLWVVFGTGRVWSSKDLTPCGGIYEKNPDISPGGCCDNHTQYFFGLKELLKDKKHLTFKEITDGDKILDVSGLEVFDDGNVYSDQSTTVAYTYSNLYQTLISDDPLLFKRGYKRKLESWRGLYIESPPDSGNMVPEEAPTLTQFEMVTTQPKIDGLPNGGSNTVFTSYLTSADVCSPDGKSYLNVVDTFTGLPAPYMKTYGGFETGRSITAGQSAARQITGVKRAGDGMASEAWILKSGSQTIYGNTSFNSNRNKIYVDQGEGNAIVSWREVLDMNFKLLGDDGALNNLFNDLK